MFKLTTKEVIDIEKMASNLECSFNRGSDLFFDFSCFPCQESDRNTEAAFYCEECSRLYCSKCVEHHNYLYKKHTILGKKNISQWPETNVGDLEQCQEHRKEKLTGFCEDHNQLICHACHVHNHKKCSHVVLIADKVKDLDQKGDFKQLSATLDTQHQQFIRKKDDFEENMKSLEKSYKKILEEINALRREINDSLDQLEKNTKMELDTFLATMRTSIHTDIENCTKSIKNITCLKEDLLQRKDKNEAQSIMKYRKCLDQSLKVEAILQEMTTKNERTLTFNPDATIKQCMSTLSRFGQILSTVKQSQPSKRTTQNTVTRDNTANQTTPQFKVNKSNPESRQYSPGNKTSDLTKSGQVSDPVSSSSQQLNKEYQPGTVSKSDQIIKVKSSKKYSVKTAEDFRECGISGFCDTATGELLITDYSNHQVKLLDQNFNVVAHCKLPTRPYSMCRINSSQVAVTGDNFEVYFISVTNGQLIKDRTLRHTHFCIGIAHHEGNLYITDGTAVYCYTVDGILASKLYENTSTKRTVTSCAVSPDGDRIYVVNMDSKQLVTLSREGTVISKLTDSVLVWVGHLFFPGLHVTDSGQVLVCGGACKTIIQVDKDGRQRLSEVVTQKDGVYGPKSVYYSEHRGSLIVGMWDDDIIVFKAE